MRLRKLELVVIGLTLAFVCFLGGYFTGAKTAVNVVTVESNDSQMRLPVSTDTQNGSITGAGAGNVQTDDRSPEATDAAAPGGSAQVVDTGITVKESDGRININLASRSELMDLPGIGSVLAERIIEYRKQNGSFIRIEDLRNITGIGERRFDAIKDMITV